MSVMCDSIAVAMRRSKGGCRNLPWATRSFNCEHVHKMQSALHRLLRRVRPRGRSIRAVAASRTIAPMRLLRFAKILYVALKHGLDEFLLGHERFRWLRPAAHALTFWRDTSAPRAERLRLALQDLGPIFVKFG